MLSISGYVYQAMYIKEGAISLAGFSCSTKIEIFQFFLEKSQKIAGLQRVELPLQNFQFCLENPQKFSCLRRAEIHLKNFPSGGGGCSTSVTDIRGI